MGLVDLMEESDITLNLITRPILRDKASLGDPQIQPPSLMDPVTQKNSTSFFQKRSAVCGICCMMAQVLTEECSQGKNILLQK